MKRSTLASAIAACLCFGCASPLLAAEPSGVDTSSPRTCQSDLRAFDSQMEKDGYGLGYPMSRLPGTAETSIGYLNARPGYEVRALLASANILARNGQQQLCENVLAAASDGYKRYIADLQDKKIPTTGTLTSQNPLLETAVPVSAESRPFRSDELVNAVVYSPENVNLGSVDDIVMSPKTGKIAYLVIARGGIFGIDEKYVPVPWGDFKVIPNMDLLVLDASKDVMDAAPQVTRDQFGSSGYFDQESQKVDDYWKERLASKGNN